MSGSGALSVNPDELSALRQTASELRLAVVAARWHTRIMDGLVAGADRFLSDVGVELDAVTRLDAPGSFELPVLAAQAAQTHDAVVALGVVIRGGTPHFEYVCSAAAQGLTAVSVQTRTPIGFGLLTCDDEQQALDRAGLSGSREDKGYEAAHAAVATAVQIRSIS